MDTLDDEFVRLALGEFASCLRPFGLAPVSFGPSLLVFAVAPLTVRVFKGRRSQTIGVEIERSNENVNLGHLLEFAGEPSPGFTTLTSELTARRLAWLGEFLARNYGELLGGDAAAFEAVASVAKRHDENYTESLVVQPVLANARQAFRERRYGDVVDQLSPIEEELQGTDQWKLKIARKRAEP